MYKKAIIYDKRTYVQFYLSLLKTRHILMFSFCPAKDYNSKIVKIYLFFYSFVMYLAVNALFYVIPQCIKYMKMVELSILFIKFLK